MKRLVAAVVVLAGAFVAWRTVDGRMAPERQYKAFAEDILHRRFDDAAARADGLTATQLARTAAIDPAMLQTLFPSRFEITSRAWSGDELTLAAVQTALFNPPGVESALRPAMFATLNQSATLRKTDGGWKVTRFESKLAKMDTVSER